MIMKHYVLTIGYFLSFMVANIIFLGVADDSKVVAKLKCNIWFQLHNKQMDVSLSDRSSFEVKYFVRYLCHIPIIIFQDFFLISKLPYAHYDRLISFGDKLW